MHIKYQIVVNPRFGWKQIIYWIIMALERLTEKGRTNLRLLEEKKKQKIKENAMKQAYDEFDQDVDANVKKVINNYRRILELSKIGDAERATLDELSLKIATKEISTATDALLGMVQDLKLNAELGNIMQNNNNNDNNDNNDNGNYSSSMKMNIDSA